MAHSIGGDWRRDDDEHIRSGDGRPHVIALRRSRCATTRHDGPVLCRLSLMRRAAPRPGDCGRVLLVGGSGARRDWSWASRSASPWWPPRGPDHSEPLACFGRFRDGACPPQQRSDRHHGIALRRAASGELRLARACGVAVGTPYGDGGTRMPAGGEACQAEWCRFRIVVDPGGPRRGPSGSRAATRSPRALRTAPGTPHRRVPLGG